MVHVGCRGTITVSVVVIITLLFAAMEQLRAALVGDDKMAPAAHEEQQVVGQWVKKRRASWVAIAIDETQYSWRPPLAT